MILSSSFLGFFPKWMTPPYSPVLKLETWMSSFTSIFPSPPSLKSVEEWPNSVNSTSLTPLMSSLPLYPQDFTASVQRSPSVAWPIPVVCIPASNPSSRQLPQRMWKHKSDQAVPQPVPLLCPVILFSSLVFLMHIYFSAFWVNLCICSLRKPSPFNFLEVTTPLFAPCCVQNMLLQYPCVLYTANSFKGHLHLQCSTWPMWQRSHLLSACSLHECWFIFSSPQSTSKTLSNLKCFFLRLSSQLLGKPLDTFEPQCTYISGYYQTYLWVKVYVLPVLQLLV